MSRPHFYPQGAVQTIEALCDYQGRTLFRGYGLGQSSFVSATRVGKPHWHENVRGWFFGERDSHSDRFCAEDNNIGAHYNKNYIFLTEADAKAYVEWAKTNTTRNW